MAPDDSIQRHVRTWRRDHGRTDVMFVPLWFSLGEIYQFDWSHEMVVLGSTTTTGAAIIDRPIFGYVHQ